LYGERGDGAAALRTALRAHHLAIVVRDRKAQAQTAATVALAHLTLGDAPTAIEWTEDCLTIASDTYPYVEVEGLLALATARRTTGDETAALSAAKQAESIAKSCGFRLLEAQATGQLSLDSEGSIRSRA
jgi:ATP/maltotriose-dependent transcriptional regulator MalT